jgi:hypothetical protein
MANIAMNLVTPKAGAKHELLFNKLASGKQRVADFVKPSHFKKIR